MGLNGSPGRVPVIPVDFFFRVMSRKFCPKPDPTIEEDPRGITCLGSLIYEKDNQLHIRYLNKNEEFLHGHEQKNGKILRFQHATSFSPQQQKNGVVIGEFCRVQRLTSDHNDLVEQSLLLAKEMNLLGITSKQLSTIFLRKYKNTNNSVWQLLHDLMKTEHKKL